MANTDERFNTESERKHNNGILFRPMTFFLVIVAIIFVMGVFFEISVVEVTGNSRYTTEQIVTASGIHTGDSLFFINRIGAGSRIVVKLPYIESVQITRKLPNSIFISVEESKACACIKVGDALWSVSHSGKFLGEINEAEAKLIPVINGLTVTDAKTGDPLSTDEASQPALDYLLEMLYQIRGRNIGDKIKEIDVSDANDPTLVYDDRFVVRFGPHDDTEYKFGKMLSAVTQLMPDDSGTMDLSDSDKVDFRPN